jgi:hypothetical protein
MQATDRLATIVKKHHSLLRDSYAVLVNLLKFQLSAVIKSC